MAEKEESSLWKAASKAFKEQLKEALVSTEIPESRVLGPVLHSAFDSWECYSFDSVDSTMNVAQKLSSELSHGRSEVFEGSLIEGSGEDALGNSVILSAAQNVGRGRESREWFSAAGEGLYLTYVLFPKRPPEELTGFSLAVGIAVCEAMSSFGISCGVKWPNDVLTKEVIDGERKKLAGVLIELSSSGGSLRSLRVGIGANINQQAFPEGVPGASMRQMLGREVDYFSMFAVLSSYVAATADQYFSHGFSFFKPFWQSMSLVDGASVRIRRSPRDLCPDTVGIVRGVGADGGLIVCLDEGREEILYSGEVEFVDAARD